jgi:hypothetical protein
VPAALPTAAQVQHAVTGVYARPEYQESHHWRDWFYDRVGRAFMWLLDRIQDFSKLRHSHPLVYWAVVGWMALTVVAIVAHLVWTAVQASKYGDRDAAKTAKAKAAKPRGPAEWETEAARLAGEGRFREAAVALYQALLLRLDARGAVRFDPSKTPGDYRREARPHADAAKALTSFLRLFEPVAFGGRALDEDGWERMRTAAAAGGAGA